jgi:outer membrane protein OmpA-like peptidoglycan-associated protein
MKNHFSYLIIFCLLGAGVVFSQSDQQLEAGYYVVVGAFGVEGNAIRFVETLQNEGHESAAYGLDPFRNLNYVYVLYSTNFKEALSSMNEYRRDGTFDEAWVKTITGKMPMPPPVVQVETEPEMEKEEAVEEPPVITEEEESDDGYVPLGAIAVTEVAEEEKKGEIVEEVNERIETVKPSTLASIQVFLNLFNPTNNRIVAGQVQVIDTERAKLITKVDGNKLLFLPSPGTHSGEISMITDLFGYRKVQHEINYFQPLADTVDNAIEYTDGVLIINFDMVRYRKGDITVLYNVYFYDDAALMRPESRFELNTLLEMMKENPEYRIMLHGHTNAKYYGEILSLGPQKNFFEITDDAVSSNGTAKNLARKRAETIREYLVVNGIAEDRVEIKSWGGKSPIVNPLGPDARQNVRVEVEILED